jgi:hypothetical protein
MPRLTDALRQELERLLIAGHSDRSIRRQTGIATRTIAKHRERLGLPVWRANPNDDACRHGHPYPENLRQDRDGHRYCQECRRIRHRAQYVPVVPDDAAVERAVFGEPPARLTPRERLAAIQRLDSARLPAAVIAERVGCSKRTVHRVRSKAVA